MITIQNKRDKAYYSSLFTTNIIHETPTEIITSQPIPMHTSVYERFVDRLDSFVHQKLVDHYAEQNGNFIITLKKNKRPEQTVKIKTEIEKEMDQLTPKEKDFYNALVKNSTSSDVEMIVSYSEVEGYSPSQIGAYITILKKKGVITGLQKKNKIAVIKRLLIMTRSQII